MGETLGRYTLLRRVAAGGMAEIWKAKAIGPAGFQKTVAIKRILPHLVEETEFIQMFIDEAKLAAELVHPNIIQVFDFGQLGPNDYFIAMEYVSGPSLARLLKRIAERQGGFPAICALYVVMEAAKGLAHAHAKTDEAGNPLNIIHRDVSPQNILISYAGDVKVGDFGIAKAAGAVTRTMEGQVRGKLSYMSPEQALGKKGIDGRSDLFALGVVLYELVTGRRLFPTNLTTVEAYGRVANFKGLDLEDVAAVPQPFREMVAKALRADPDERFQTGLELEVACTNMLGSKGIANARAQLATMVQALFEEERKVEMTPTSGGIAMPDLAPPAAAGAREGVTTPQPVSAPLVVGSVSGVVHSPESETVKSPIQPVPVPPAQPLRAPSPTPSPQTGLTLASSKHNVAPAIQVTAEEPRRRPPALVAGLAGGALLLAVAGGFALKGLVGGGTEPAATPAATPFAAASPVVTASVAPATPTATPDATATATAAAAIPTATNAKVVGTRLADAATPAPTPRVTQAPVGRGMLSVTSRPWVQVWVDGKMVKAETPLQGHKLPSGRHTVRFVNPGLGFDESRTINVPADGEINVVVDVRAKKISVR